MLASHDHGVSVFIGRGDNDRAGVGTRGYDDGCLGPQGGRGRQGG